jgi:hypothetical protein
LLLKQDQQSHDFRETLRCCSWLPAVLVQRS